jgi:D-threo-aldose 1-dehydrogenase
MTALTAPRRRVGRTDVAVTPLGFGGAPVGNLYTAMSDEQAAAAVDAAWAAGVRYFDTAPHYGLGLSERRIGAALGRRPRAEYVLSSKVGRLLVPNPAPTGSDLAALFDVPDDLTRERDYTADGVRRSVEESLTRLRTDHLDIALVHDPDDVVDQALTEAIPALLDLREQGVVRAVGVGMNQVAAPARFVRESDVDVVLVAGRWTLLDRGAADLLELCADRGVSMLAAAPYNSGLLAHPDPGTEATYDYRTVHPDELAAARALAARARAHGAELPQAALQFPLRHPAVAAVVAGLRTPAEVEAAAGWLATPVPDAFWSSP